MDKLKNKVILITGGGNGIGKEVALSLAAEGAMVVIADINPVGEEVANEINARGGKATYVNVHVAKESDCQQMIKVTEQTFGKLDILFNNAGIMHAKDGNIIELEEKIWDMTMSVNAKGIYLCCKHAIPALLRAGGGSVINSASFVALVGMPQSKMAYTASKAAVIALTRDLAAQYASDNIRFNALCPGPILTEAFSSYLTDKEKQHYLQKIPVKRFGTPKEVAKAVLYLASDDSSYLTGNTFMIDGGITSLIPN